jgi:hypothetical protein
MPSLTRAFAASTALVLVLCAASPAAAQLNDNALIRKQWIAALQSVAPRHQLTVDGTRLSGPQERKAAAYEEAVDIVEKDPVLLATIYADPNAPEYHLLVAEKVREEDRKFIQQLKAAGAAETSAKSVNSRSSNPAAGLLTERSGFAELLAFALDAKNALSSNESAVSLNLNALALISLADPEVYSELYRYQQHSLLRRIGGTFVLGAKIPEKEITGLSNLPEFDKLLDVFVWDVKVRLWGNRDPRDQRWYPLTIGRGGFNNQLAAAVLGLVGVQDEALVKPFLEAIIDPTAIKRRIARSPQLSFKATGTHLTKEVGKNKYSAALLFDAGLGKADVTANLLYSLTDDVSLGAENLFQVKLWTVNTSVTAKLAQDALVTGSAIEWSSGVVANLFAEKTAMPLPVKNTWKLFTSFDVPLNSAARIPFSVVYSNDPNALQKTKFVSGQVGVSYDFSALTKLFRGN